MRLRRLTDLMNSSTSDDPDEVVALGPNDSFFIGGKAIDAAGNNVGKNAELSWEITDDADNADDAEDTLDDHAGGRTLERITVNGSDEAGARHLQPHGEPRPTARPAP